MAQVRTHRSSADPTTRLGAATSVAGASLRVVRGAAPSGALVAVDPHGTLVGRDASNDLVLASARVSRRHALVTLRDGDVLVRDLGSANGTWVGEHRVVGVRAVRTGTRIRFGDVDVDLVDGEADASPRGPSDPQDDAWDPYAPTQPLPPRAHGRRVRAVRSELHDAQGFSGPALALAVGGSVVASVLSSAAGTSQWGTLAAAAVGPIVTASFSTSKGRGGGVRLLAVALLSAAALFITVTGVSLADIAAGESVLPGAEPTRTTFPTMADVADVAEEAPAPTQGPDSGPAIAVEPSAVDCGQADVGTGVLCDTVTVISTGAEPLVVTSVEVTGEQPTDVTADAGCAGATLAPGETCVLGIAFTPTAAGPRSATVVVHQNLPLPDTGTAIAVTGTGVDPGDSPPGDLTLDG